MDSQAESVPPPRKSQPKDSDGEQPTDEPAPDDGQQTPDPDGEKPADPPPAEPAAQFDKDDQPFLKKMSKEASAHFGKKITALKEQLTTAQASQTDLQSKLDAAEGKKLPDQWYEHERAFELSPKFQEISGKFGEEQKITNFWHAQLERCKANSDLRDGDEFIPYYIPGPDGKLLEVTEDKYSSRHEVSINDLRQQHYKNQEKLSDEAERVKEDFVKTHKQSDKGVRDAVSQHLPWVADEKSPLQKTMKDIIAKAPAVYRDHPMTHAFAAMSAQMLYEKAARMDLEAKIKAAKGVEDDQREAGPIPGRARTKKDSSEDTVYKDGDFVGM